MADIYTDSRGLPVDFSGFRIGHAAAGSGPAVLERRSVGDALGAMDKLHHHQAHKRAILQQQQQLMHKRDDQTQFDCRSGAFYVSPKWSPEPLSIDAPINVQWDNDCLPSGTSAVDIYLYVLRTSFAPDAPFNSMPIHKWQGVPTGKPSYQADVKPGWWNATATEGIQTAKLQFSIVPAGNEVWDSQNPAGDVFEISYNATAQTVAAEKNAPLVERWYKKFKALAGGSVAAAVILPLLAIAGIVAFFFIRHKRKKTAAKRHQWSVHMDKRMSTISGDWKAGAVPPNARASRNSSFFPRPTSMRPVSSFQGSEKQTSPTHGGHANLYENDDAYDGADYPDEHHDAHNMSQRGLSIYAAYATEGDRTSKISFAENTAGDRVSRVSTTASTPRIGTSRLNPNAPPLPSLSTRGLQRDAAGDDGFAMSPSQSQGPAPLHENEIAERVSMSADRPTSTAIDNEDTMAAIRLVSTGSSNGMSPSYSSDQQQYQQQQQQQYHGLPSTHPALGLGMGGMAPMPSAEAHLGPDAAMRQYAASRAAGSSPVPGQAVPMRALYSQQPSAGSQVGSNNPFSNDDHAQGHAR